jgi:hypothetical protein
MRRPKSQIILCTQCAHIYPDTDTDPLSCPQCHTHIATTDYALLIKYSREAARFGHIYRLMYEEAKKHDDCNTRAQIELHELWAFAALAALSGIIGNASFETVKLVIRKIIAFANSHSPARSRPMLINGDDEQHLHTFLSNLQDFANGMQNVDPWVRHVIVEEMLVDQSTNLMCSAEELKVWRRDDQPAAVTRDTVKKLLSKTVKSGSITEKPSEEALTGLWQILVQAVPAHFDADTKPEKNLGASVVSSNKRKRSKTPSNPKAPRKRPRKAK